MKTDKFYLDKETENGYILEFATNGMSMEEFDKKIPMLQRELNISIYRCEYNEDCSNFRIYFKYK